MAEEADCSSLVARGKRLSSDDEFLSPSTTLPPRVQGHDYEFVPTLDPKYECPICLLCQRDPTQTTCGHRFCRECIVTWISKEKNRCPEDNSFITEHDLFPDNFAKREIMSLIARCPNTVRGCTELFELSNIEDHHRVCEYELVACPNNCNITIPRNCLESHIFQDCFQRKIKCKLCHMDFIFKDLEDHSMECPMVTVSCEQCTALLPRHKLQPHMLTDCPRTRLPCPFNEIGCNEKLEREEMDLHDKNQMHLHLQLLTSAFQAFKFTVGNLLQRNELGHSDSLKEKLSYEISSGKINEHSKSEMEVLQLRFNKEQDQIVSSTIPASLEKLDLVCQEKKMNSWIPSSIETIQDLYQRNVQLEQKSREQEIKMDALRLKLSECERTIKEQTDSMNLDVLEARFCNGVYFWRVNNFSRLRVEAAHGHSRVLHSPGFYTSCFGYKVCLRLNIQGKNSMHVSLFIHLMQGDYDNMLNWPFIGKIVLSILDQEDRSENRADITETMLTKPGLTAFQRPVTERNPKGFGYTEFASIDTLLSGSYVKNDQLFIKAAVTL